MHLHYLNLPLIFPVFSGWTEQLKDGALINEYFKLKVFGCDDNTSLLVPNQTPATLLYNFGIYHILGKEQDDYVPFFFRKCILMKRNGVKPVVYANSTSRAQKTYRNFSI